MQRSGASDPELLAHLRTPDQDGSVRAKPVSLTDEQGKELLAGLRQLMGRR